MSQEPNSTNGAKNAEPTQRKVIIALIPSWQKNHKTKKKKSHPAERIEKYGRFGRQLWWPLDSFAV